ncbi:MAG: Gfo/Idh/MocA family oxidoreductase [Planctomycetes bacterium]|nr:Gfo/Idh/MocA family oxidoreductase [Planctomycetota bacterium]
MSAKKIKTAVLGLSNNGVQLLEAAEATGLYDIVAVADRDMELAERSALLYQCPAFDDYRQLVLLKKPQVLLAAAPLHTSEEFIRLAIKEGIHVIRLVPPGLDFESTADFIRMARRNNVRYFVANFWRPEPGFARLREHLKATPIDKFRLIQAVCNFPGEIDNIHSRWLSDPKLTGGGVLLRNCYEMIDLIVSNFGVPEQVYSINTNHAPDRQQRLSITEDTAIVTMKFSDTLLGNLLASRIFGPPVEVLRLHTAENVLAVKADSFIILDNNGSIIEETKFQVSKTDCMKETLSSFAESILSPKNHPLTDAEDAYINTMAVIESAYLSARTAAPEEPQRILNMVKTK